MRLFDRWRPAEVRADVGAGFWVAEAPAMQHAIVGALTAAERSGTRASAELRFEPGAEGRVVVLWRNLIVGFVPPAATASLRGQLNAAGKAPLVADGTAVAHGGLWRVWAGSGEPADQPPPAGTDELEPPSPSILGMVMRGRESPARTTTAVRRILTVGTHSWEVRDGTDLDLALLRRRIAGAAPGATLHVRLWDETVVIDLPHTRVTLADPVTGEVEVLHPG